MPCRVVPAERVLVLRSRSILCTPRKGRVSPRKFFSVRLEEAYDGTSFQNLHHHLLSSSTLVNQGFSMQVKSFRGDCSNIPWSPTSIVAWYAPTNELPYRGESLLTVDTCSPPTLCSIVHDELYIEKNWRNVKILYSDSVNHTGTVPIGI